MRTAPPDGTVEGWLTPLECDLLFRLARQCTGRGIIVEIGSYKGKSTVCLARGSQAGSRVAVHAIDPHTGSPEYGSDVAAASTLHAFTQHLRHAGVEDLVVPHVMTSEQASRELQDPVELLFIDGAHDIVSVAQDAGLWLPRVVSGGVVAFHDSVHMPGPARVSRDRLFLSRLFRGVRFVHSTSYGCRTDTVTAAEHLANRARLALRDIYALCGRRPMPSGLKRVLGAFVRRF